MRLVLDITKTRDGRYEGFLTVPGTAGQHDFAGILELLAIVEKQFQLDKSENDERAEHDSGTGRDAIVDGGAPA